MYKHMGESVKLVFERGIWRETFWNVFQNKLVFATVIGLLLGMAILSEITGRNGSGGANFAWAFLAIAAHSTILNRKAGFASFNDHKIFLPFILRGLFFSLVPLFGAIPALLAFGDLGSKVLGLIFTAIAFGFLEALLLAKWGSWLPATVAGGDKTFSAASRRGTKTFGYVFGRLLGCSTLLWVVAAILGFGIFFIFVLVKQSLAAPTLTVANDIRDWIITILVFIVASIQTVLLATVLSRAYLIAENQMPVSNSA
jgi:hypothetical protein